MQIFPHQHQLPTNCRGLQKVSVSGDSIQLRELIISKCPELEELPSLSRLSCMEQIEIVRCEKLKTITLPTSLTSLSIARCTDLQRVSGNGDLVQLRELLICECPELEELPSLSRLSCMETIVIEDCEKLKTMTLPTSLTSLSITSCTDLQRVSGNGDLVKLRELIICECPELEELPSLSIQCRIEIDFCEKLKKISGIEELPALQWMRLGHCSNALIRNCIHNLKSVPSQGMMTIGRAVGGAESCFNKDLFCDCIGVDEVIENSDCGTPDIFSPYSQAIVVCFLVIADSSDLAEKINRYLRFHIHLPVTHLCGIKMRQGQSIITVFSSGASESSFLEDFFQFHLRKYGIIKKRLHIKVKNAEERNVMGVYHTIAEKLHQGD